MNDDNVVVDDDEEKKKKKKEEQWQMMRTGLWCDNGNESESTLNKQTNEKSFETNGRIHFNRLFVLLMKRHSGH